MSGAKAKHYKGWGREGDCIPAAEHIFVLGRYPPTDRGKVLPRRFEAMAVPRLETSRWRASRRDGAARSRVAAFCTSERYTVPRTRPTEILPDYVRRHARRHDKAPDVSPYPRNEARFRL